MNVCFCAFSCSTSSEWGGRGGAGFGGSLPEGREGERVGPFSYALPPMNFHGARAQGGASFGGSLRSAAALLVYACQRVGRASVLNLFFCAYAVPFSLTAGRFFRGIFTIDEGAFGGYMPAGQEGKRAEPFFFSLSPLNFHGAGGRGGKGFGGSLPSAAEL